MMYPDDNKISISPGTMQIERDAGGTKQMVTEQGACADGYDGAGPREHGTAYLNGVLRD